MKRVITCCIVVVSCMVVCIDDCRACNTPPQVYITAPLYDETTVAKGDAVSCVAVGDDAEDGPEELSFWWFVYKQNSWGRWDFYDYASSQGSPSEWVFEFSQAGRYRITAQVCDTGGLSDEDTRYVTAVEPARLQYYRNQTETWEDVPAVLNVCVGSGLTFKGVPTPGTTWPDGKPTWSGTAGASGTGETKWVVFNVPSANPTDLKTVTVECGSSVTAQVYVLSEWIPGPAPTGTISCTNGQQWDHINDTRDAIPLSVVNATDHDTRWVNGEYAEQTTNYISASATEWSWDTANGYCSPTTGISTSWYATATGQPTWVKARLKDQPTNPNASANDEDVYTVSYTGLHGFKVGVRANFNGAWSGTLGTVWEGSSGSYSGGAAVQHVAYSNGASAPGEHAVSDYFYVEFAYKTEPSDAVPAGDVRANVGLGLHAYWSGLMKDCDLWDEEGDRVSIGCSARLNEKWSVSFSYAWNLTDAQEAMCAGDWAYSTDSGLGSVRSPSGDPLFAYQSGDGPDDLEAEWELSQDLNRSALKTWGKAGVVRGQFDVSTVGYATAHCSGDYVNAHMSMSSPSVVISNVEYVP